MIEAIGLGFAYGVSLSFMLGTVFFALLKYGLEQGYRAGMAIATGVIVSDVLFILLAFGFTQSATELIQDNQQWVLLIGGILIFLFGLFGIVVGSKAKNDLKPVKQLGSVKLALLGFTLNISNPVNFFAWATIQTLMVTKVYSITRSVSFLVSSLLAIFVMEVLIAFFANKLKARMNQATIHVINKVIYLIFILIGIYLSAQSMLQ